MSTGFTQYSSPSVPVNVPVPVPVPGFYGLLLAEVVRLVYGHGHGHVYGTGTHGQGPVIFPVGTALENV